MMKLIRLHALSPQTQLPALALSIGNFDGVHKGHQALIHQLKLTAQQKQLHTAVMIFEPQPLEFFLNEQAPARITSLREKLSLFKSLHIDYVIIAKFDHQFRELSAHDFAELLKRLNVQHLTLGDDFVFGKNRQGNKQFLLDSGFQVNDLKTVLFNKQRISSTRIREVLAQGDFALASQLLGRPYSITGRIVYGDQIGRTIDFPTINVALKRPKPCLHGIYAVDVSEVNGNLQYAVQQQSSQIGIAGYQTGSLFGAGHLGVRPAIAQTQPQWRLEVHFPQLSANLYGKLVTVTFLHYLHGEKNYPSLQALQAGIQSDVQALCQFRQQQQDFPF